MPAIFQESDMRPSLLLSRHRQRRQKVVAWLGQGVLGLITSVSLLALLFIIFYIGRDALPFFRLQGFQEFFTSTHWYPSHAEQPEFGAKAIFVGSGLVTLGAALFAVPLGIVAAVCLSEVLPFGLRQSVKPVIEVLSAIPSVAYGFFALVVLAPLLQDRGGVLMKWSAWGLGAPVLLLFSMVAGDVWTGRIPGDSARKWSRRLATLSMMVVSGFLLWRTGQSLGDIAIKSGTNALNVSLILGIMALPTIISVSEDALQSVGRELREGSYALGATRAETVVRVLLPAAGSGIAAAAILGIMRAIGETMVVWMASGNASQIPEPWYNLLSPVRTLTATIAGDMGEADHVTGSSRYHVLFAMALCLLLVALISNSISEALVRRARRKAGG